MEPGIDSNHCNQEKNEIEQGNEQHLQQQQVSEHQLELEDMSVCEESALNRTCDLIGDRSQPYALPTLNDVKHDRFKRIDAATMVKLIDGHFKDVVESFTIVDCRYPYEYRGGHIINSLNIHTDSELVELFLNQKPPKTSLRNIIIFHCEFSSERGPKLMRLLREKDRQLNQYPSLDYPELYLLDGGYSKFFKTHKNYCDPQAYQPMKSGKHRDEYKKCRKRRKAQHLQCRRKNQSLTPDISFEA